jgi:type IV fimbrial biogenesis protein FimT
MIDSVRSKGGFSLVEFLITLAVAAILLSVMVPEFREFLVNNRTTAQADGFLSVVQAARSEAVKRSVPVRVSAISPDASENEWGKGARLWIDENNNGVFNAAADENQEDDVADTLLASFDLLAGAHTLNSTNNNDELVFSPTGRSGVTDSFYLCGDQNEGIGREIYVTRTGRVGVTEHACE